MLGKHLAAFFQQAFELVDSGVAASQEVIQRLSCPGGLHRIHELCERAINLSPEPIFLQEVLPFFKILAHHDVINSPSLDDHLRTIYAFIGHNTVRFGDLFGLFIDQIQFSHNQDRTSPSEAELITMSATILSKLLDHSIDATINDRVKEIASSLASLFRAAEFDGAMQADVVRRLRRVDRRLRLGFVFAEVTSQSLQPAEQPKFIVRKEPPGGRHDNDYEDICEISILPTIAEIQSIRNEYLPIADPDSWHTAPDQGLNGLLDRQFRLLREDSVGPLREAIRETLETIRGGHHGAASEHQRAARTLRYSKVIVRNVEIDTNICGPVFTVSFEIPSQLKSMGLNDECRKSWWFKSGRLAAEGLV